MVLGRTVSEDDLFVYLRLGTAIDANRQGYGLPSGESHFLVKRGCLDGALQVQGCAARVGLLYTPLHQQLASSTVAKGRISTDKGEVLKELRVAHQHSSRELVLWPGLLRDIHTIARRVPDGGAALNLSSFGNPSPKGIEIGTFRPYPRRLDVIFVRKDRMRPLSECDNSPIAVLRPWWHGGGISCSLIRGCIP